MTPYFEARNLRKTWPGTRIDFSCSVEKGKMLGITGRSGSGKSTVLRIIAGLLEADCEENRQRRTLRTACTAFGRMRYKPPCSGKAECGNGISKCRPLSAYAG